MKYNLILVIPLLIFSTGIASSSCFSLRLSQIHKLVVTKGDHEVNKRQNQFEPIPERCTNEVRRLLCQTGLAEQLVHLALNCQRPDDAELHARWCDVNSAREFCGYHAESSYRALIQIEDECVYGGSTNTGDECPSQECTNTLHAARSSRAGCCIETLFNNTDNIFREQAFSYSLWSQCGVEPFQLCEQTIPRTPLPNAIPCTDEEYDKQNFMTTCSKVFNDILERVEELNGCNGTRQSYNDLCLVNDEGKQCIDLDSEDSYEAVITAQIACKIDQQNCSRWCREALETLAQTNGCCFNLAYNGTFYQPFANYTLWNQCGVETPPLTCRNLLDKDDKSKAHHKEMAIITLIVAFFLATWN